MSTSRTWLVGGAYNAGVAKVGASYHEIKNPVSGLKEKGWQVGANVPLGAFSLTGQVGQLKALDGKNTCTGADQCAARVREVVQAAKDHGCSMRIGVNAGSLEPDLLEKYGEPCPEAMVESALNHAKILDDLDFREYKISVKASDPFLAVAAYQALSEAIDCPLHVGITEAGGMISGTVKSSIGMGMLPSPISRTRPNLPLQQCLAVGYPQYRPARPPNSWDRG